MKWIRTLRWRTAQYLELRWWRWYLRGRSPATYLVDKQAYWQRLLDQLQFTIDPDAQVLDAGCGPAGVFTLLHDRQRVTALDPLLPRYVTLPIFSFEAYPTVTFLPEPLEEARLHETFSTIYCFNAINHVSDWSQSLDTLTRLARPGTRLILSSDVHRHDWLLPIFRALPGDALHPQQHLAADYRNALSRRGWRIDREQELRRERIFSYRAWVCTYA
ncbi:hypothetical protein LEM8419_01360 [Neolewinella maritima]|uniref:Class I SAM-dependent methyltransferase n=1 Tax=Neolewinella maritima TaxID=1383882 RepID=A0ABN8F1I2_9BACT|nr:methyltransferase domain-containing protein [Neolewinella maritima]CAH1000212.1 hypothetical protein LEM8419_01360 [Neolewinella maritima]